MKVTQEMIESEISKLSINNKTPRFVLLDHKTYDDLNDSLKTNCRIPNKDGNIPKIIKLYSNYGILLEVLQVNIDRDFFEVV